MRLCLLLLVAMVGTACARDAVGSTLPTRGASTDELRVLSMFPDDVVVLVHADLAAARRVPTVADTLTAIIEQSEGDLAPFADLAEVWLGFGGPADSEPACFGTDLMPREDGCPETQRESEYSDSSSSTDVLRPLRASNGRISAMPFLVARFAGTSPCADLPERGLTRAGVRMVRVGNDLCALVPTNAGSRLRDAGGEIVAPGALALRDAPRSDEHNALIELGLATTSPLIDTWLTRPDGYVPRDLRLLRMMRLMLAGSTMLRVTGGTRLDGDAEITAAIGMESTEAAVGVVAIERFFIEVFREAQSPRERARFPIEAASVQRGDSVELRVRVPTSVQTQFLENLEETFARLHDPERRPESDYAESDAAYRRYRTWREALMATFPLAPPEALARLPAPPEDLGPDLADISTVALASIRPALSALTGNFADAAEQVKDANMRCSSLPARIALALALYTFDPEMATDIVARAGRTRDDTCYDEYEGTNDASLDDAIRLFDDVIEPMLAGDTRAVDRALQIERSTLRPAADRFPNAAIDESGNLLRIDALLMRGAIADALMVLRHLPIGDEHEHAIAMRLAFAQIEAGQAAQALDAPLARVIADEVRETGSDQEWWGMVDQAERVWMRCRAERRALGDARALPMCEAAERLATEFHGNVHPNTARARVELAEALKGLRRTADARAMAQRAVDALATTHTRHPLRATARALAR